MRAPPLEPRVYHTQGWVVSSGCGHTTTDGAVGLSHPADSSSVFLMYADTPHRTGSCMGCPVTQTTPQAIPCTAHPGQDSPCGSCPVGGGVHPASMGSGLDGLWDCTPLSHMALASRTCQSEYVTGGAIYEQMGGCSTWY